MDRRANQPFSLALIGNSSLEHPASGESSLLQAATLHYLLANNLLQSARNFTLAKEVIRTGVAEVKKKFSQQNPGSLPPTFAQSYELFISDRAQQISQAREADKKLKTMGDESSPLALSPNIVSAARQELTQPYLVPNLTGLSLFTKDVNRRLGVYKVLLDHARSQVTSQIPGSKDIALTPEQESGLVRNLVFSWVTNIQPGVLLDVTDIIASQRSYLSFPPQERAAILEARLSELGVDPSSAPGYLRALSNQVASLLEPATTIDLPTTGDMVKEMERLGEVNRLLKNGFLLDYPFYYSQIPDLSLRPENSPNTVWSPQYSDQVDIFGQHFQIVKPQVLKMLSYRKSANPDSFFEARRLMSAAASVERFQSVYREEENKRQTEINPLKTDLNEKYVAFADEIDKLLNGEVPQSVVLSSDRVRDYGDKQLASIASLRRFYPWLHQAIQDTRDAALETLRHYHNEPFPNWYDASLIRHLYNFRAYIRNRAYEFVHYALSARIIRSQQALDQPIADFNEIPPTTVFDLLEKQTESKIDIFRSNQVYIRNEQDLLQWQQFADEEKRDLISRINALYGPMADKLDWTLPKDPDERMQSLLFNPSFESLPIPNRSRLCNRFFQLDQVLTALGQKKQGVPIAITHLERGDRYQLTRIYDALDILTRQPALPHKTLAEEFKPTLCPFYRLISATGRSEKAEPFWPARYLITILGSLSGNRVIDSSNLKIKDIPQPDRSRKSGDSVKKSSYDWSFNKQQLKASLRNYLADLGFEWDDETFQQLVIPTRVMFNIFYDARILAEATQTEEEVKAWLQNTKTRLEDRLENPPLVLKGDPASPVEIQSRRLNTLRETIQRLRATSLSKINRALTPLKEAGVAIPAGQLLKPLLPAPTDTI